MQRFQQRHGLAVDGIVGRQTRRVLFAGTSRPTASSHERKTQPGTLDAQVAEPELAGRERR